MEFDLHPSVTLQSGTFNALVAPEDLVLVWLNDTRELQRFMFLYVCGNYSRLLSGIHRRAAGFEVQRAFTAHQLLTIVRESYHTILFLEHDPTLWEGAGDVMGSIVAAVRSAAAQSLVILYTPQPDRTFDALAARADRVFVLAPPAHDPRKGGRAGRRTCGGRGSLPPAGQMTLEAGHGAEF